ncbi:MAG TPA: SAM-dependent methyltransferase [Pseudonocardiaceae bacterium]|nr:SAM-dependent methyltransferase [Pseudonocardiaceae bacterium]
MADTPSAARVYDWYLGGANNFEVDREFGRKVEEAMPSVRAIAAANRAFLHRAVRYLADHGIRQFLDLGSGIPTVGNVHEIAQQVYPGAKVVYVDHEPVACNYAKDLLRDNEFATVVQADIRDPDTVLGHSETRQLLDFSQPVGLLLIAVLPFVADDPAPLLARYREPLVSGSYLAITQSSLDGAPEEFLAQARRSLDSYGDAGQQVTTRTKAEISSWFDDLDLIAPGVVPMPEWLPEGTGAPFRNFGDDPARFGGFGAVGRVR